MTPSPRATPPRPAQTRGRWRLAALLLSLAAPLTHAGLLTDGYQARYAVSRSGLPLGESVRVLRPLGPDHWRFDARAAPTGLAAVLFDDVIDEHSELRRLDGQVVPLRYSYDQHGGRKDKAYALRFDWQHHVLHFEHSGEQLPLPAGTQDPLSFVVAVMEHLSKGEKHFDLTIAGQDKLRDYRVDVTDQATMATVLGRQTVVSVVAQEVGKDTRYELWTLPAHEYLPLRIRQVRKRQTTELRLRQLTTPPPPADQP